MLLGLPVLLFAAGLAGCIKDRIPGPEDGGAKRAVVFSPSVSSRAATGHPIENGATIPVGDYHFGVYAWVKPTDTGSVEPFSELQNAKVQHASTAEYTYDPVASWPRDADARLACMAYYPWSDQSGNICVITGTGANQTMTINYAVPTDAGLHVDLMYAKTGMTAGYDPVNLDFRHALARLKFEGRTEDFPAGSVVKITGIKVTGAVLRGDLIVLDPATQPGKPWWELSTAPGDMGAITMPATHIKDLPLTSALQSVITPGGDMLVLPQSVTGLTVEVTASLNGAAFPEPFVFSLTSSPDWTMNEIITYEITLMPDGMHLTARVAEWTTDPVNVIQDGQYYMELSRDRLDLYKEGGGLTLEIKTDYDKINAVSGEAGSYLDVSGVGTWATVTDLGQTLSGGEYTRRVRIEAAAFDGTTNQAPGKLIVKAGNLNYVFHLTQSKDSWLTAPSVSYVMDGEIHSLPVTSVCNWTVAIFSGNEPVSGYYPVTKLLNMDGESGVNSLSFMLFNIITNYDVVMGKRNIVFRFADASGVHNTKDITMGLLDYPDGGLADRITWDAVNGQYIITNDPRDAGLYFKFGSVVGVYTDNHALKNLTPPLTGSTDAFDYLDLPWNLNSLTGASGWTAVPYTSTLTTITTAYHTAANVVAGKGDPCRLVGLDLGKIKANVSTPGNLTTADIDNGKWMLPTNADNTAFRGTGVGTHSWGANEEGNISYGVAGAELPNRNGGYGIYKFLPFAGNRNASGTIGASYGTQSSYGWCYSSQPASTNVGYCMYFTGALINTTYSAGITADYAMNVRCVRQR